MWTVKFHHFVLQEDAPRIDPYQFRRIVSVIEKKLTRAPQHYGQRLHGSLAALWRLRVGAYRVIYEIEHQQVQVLVIKIGHRRDDIVYRELSQRLKKLARYHL